MKTETIEKANKLIAKINTLSVSIQEVEKRIVEYKRWTNHALPLQQFKTVIAITEGGWKEFAFDNNVVDPLKLMQQYYEDATLLLDKYNQELTDLKD